ncbi:MAG TPA: cyclase [Lentisphaeria bacterium]|nr:MAG: cyclase [Lentisphaerae bacterium GWF2_49_21]HBC85857.1 cyclase [Lentisphaeria bacterium]
MRYIKVLLLLFLTMVLSSCSILSPKATPVNNEGSLWQVYDQYFKTAKYVDLSHVISPEIPVWEGFGPPVFGPAMNAQTGNPYSYKENGFESTRYMLSSDQLGTHIDAPAHWAPEYPATDEIPVTYAIRQLVVISIADKVHRNPNYHLRVEDILEWEKLNGVIPAGSVVFIRSDWSKSWPSPALARQTLLPGVRLEALKFLHLERKILMHGHEPMDTDSTLSLEGESWLMHNGYAQAEALANLDQVPEKGALVIIGFPKFQGGTGAYARFIAICPSDWKHGASINQLNESPLPKMDKILIWDFQKGMRIRK